MSYQFDDGRRVHTFADQYQLVEFACKNNSPFLTGDENLINLTKWYAVENKDKALIQRLEDAGHDMSSYIEFHVQREAKLKQQLANL